MKKGIPFPDGPRAGDPPSAAYNMELRVHNNDIVYQRSNKRFSVGATELLQPAYRTMGKSRDTRNGPQHVENVCRYSACHGDFHVSRLFHTIITI